MEKKVIQYIEEQGILEAGDHVLIGVSGGADSLALLYFLDKFANWFHIFIGVAHLHHGLRGPDADEDEAFVKKFCQDRKIPFFSRQRNIGVISQDEQISVEEAGRKERYAFFMAIAATHGYNRIAMGHHINDQAETMLMRLIRGTGVKGVSGIKASRDNLYIRPFLCLQKKEILNYCEINKLAFRTDATNLQRDYTRNKIRLDIMPMILEINPRAEVHFNEFCKIANEYEAFFEKYVDQIEDHILTKKENQVLLNRERWLNEEPVVQKEILRRSIFKFKGSLKEIEYNHITAFYSLLKSDKTIWEIHFPHEIQIIRRYDRVLVTEKQKSEGFFISPKRIIPNKTYLFSKEHLIVETKFVSQDEFRKKRCIFSKEIKNHSEKYFDYDKIKDILVLRSRRSGDYFYPSGMTGKKTIKKYYIDKKIDRDRRNEIPLLVIDHEVVWILGHAINQRFLADDDTKNIIRVTYLMLGEKCDSRYSGNFD
ncbi:tRNA lysidine(34) synthetase TilS [Acetobacterium carbinolicum]|jgi:tRNA(Ile)-lysidine synthase|uniref:tRNA lysidine(34) synthetase TilS n=1 Tax=Acetobacterium TaxID=33951 RepID=UPI000DBEC6F7|nr:tRNA lysidine(34) synthetase TilS [Acetobacterium sp. KB-1]AWW26817.1 tRNA lysidine(34) synthetase TilS [Acetobacterium sp. KB-1]